MSNTKKNIKTKNTFEWNKSNPCFGCNSKCCKDVSVSLHTPKTKKEWDEFRWLVAHKNVQIYKDNENDWMIEFLTPCEKLDEKSLCTIHNDRPPTCYEHSHEICVHHSDEKYYKLMFTSIEEIDEYLAKKNFKWMKK
ncbi:MAG: YkgJ family cysteine cluster protein [archaeon]|jgi:Fe-S-cluster containining protein